MPKPTHILTGPADNSPLQKIHGRSTESVSVYGKADLDRRLAEAKAAGVKVTVKPVK